MTTLTSPRPQAPRPAASGAPVHRAAPTSFAQERLWLVQQLDGGSEAYNLFRAWTLRGALDVAALERALGEIVRRHDALRTTFREHEGAPVQIIAPFGGYALAVEDLSGTADADAEVQRRAAAEAAKPFDFRAGPLFRATLLRLADGEHVLMLCIHHIVSDGWSMGVMFRELAAAYEAFVSGGQPALPALPVQYADFAKWSRRQMQGEGLAKNLAYWAERLAGAPALLELPTDRPRPAVQSHAGDNVLAPLSAELMDRLQETAQREGATLFMVLLGAFQVLLAKYSGMDDVVVGSPIAGRMRREVEGLIGFFANTLVLRTELEGAATFRDVLARVRAATLGAYEHQDVPFEKLVAELKPERSLSHTPLFQVMFSIDAGAPAQPRLAGVAVEALETAQRVARFDLSTFISRGTDGWSVRTHYRTELFDRGTVERMTDHLRRVLEQVAADPGARLADLELLDGAERALVVDRWSRSEPVQDAPCVHEAIAAQAARTPDAVAVRFEGERLTYAQLDARANQLARYLVAAGVGAETRVGLYLERGFELVTGMLATLRAGGAYVPLDPASPVERIAAMVAGSATAVVLTQERLRGALPAPHGVRVVSVDAEWPAIAAHGAEPVRGRAAPDWLAYVIHTSGSTGTPKGVGIEHRALANHMAWFIRRYGVTAADRVLQKTPINFDASVWEFYAPLMTGGELVMARHDGERDTRYLAQAVRDEGVTLLQLVPSVLRVLADEPALAGCASLRHLFCGGEALAGDLVRRVGEILPAAEVTNLYGPAECCIDTSTHACTADDYARAVVPIGRPAPGTRSHVLDARMRPSPVGVPGELCIGGVQVGRGYLGRPALTAAAFVPDPFAAEPGARMYRTGDRARWREESAGVRECVSAEVNSGSVDSRTDALTHSRTGVLEYLGRVDQQVKIRGVRMEPGEIEAVLRAAGADDCVVVARADDGGEKRLVAYVAGGPGADELRAALRRALPEYMVPSAFVALDALPLTPSGKVDRRALPAPAADARDAFVAPRTPAEEVVAGIWAEVLRLERVGARDSFFALGGHSLLGTRVISRMREVFGVDVPLRALFEGPTVAELAEAVETRRRAELPVLPPVVPMDRGQPLPLGFSQERLWFLDQMEPGSTSYNVPAVLRLAGALDRAALERALGEVVRRHEALRTVFHQAGGVPVQVIQPFAGFTLPLRDLSALRDDAREEEVRRLSAQDAAEAFDLAAGPLVRAQLLRLDDEEHVLLLCMHHIVSDGWSMGVLFRELSALYAAFRDGAGSPLPEPAVQYADFAAWQRAQLAGDALQPQVDYWKQALAGAPALLELPTDRPRPAVQTYGGGRASAELPAGLMQRLGALGRAEGATLYMVLLGAFQALLSKYAGTDDVVVGSPIAGRTRRETEELIGFFVNTLVLRTDLSGDPTFREMLRRVRQTTLGAYEHQDVPFERLVAELQPERTLSHSPLFQVMFGLGDLSGDDALALDGIEVTRPPAENQTSKFDLQLTVFQLPGRDVAVIRYNAELFERATVERMLAQLERVLEQVAADADARLSSLELMDAAERETVVQGWNRTEAAYSADVCFHDLFEARAARTPDAVALVCEDQSLTYAELNARANQLAHRLMSHGVGPDARVAMCFERGAEMIVALLGIVKAGGAYVALDASLPAERLRYMLRDSRAAALVTRAALAGTLPAEGIPVVLLDADATLGAERVENPRAAVSPESLVYTIYTSGSTGEPKGVGVEHRQIVNYVHGIRDRLGLEEGASYATVSTLSADLGNTVVFSALAWGGTLHVIREERIFSGDAVGEYFARHGIDCLKITPSHLAALQNGGDPRRVMPRRWLVLGGESSPLGWVDSLLRMAPECAVFNHYGPTETTVGALTFRATAERPETPSQTLVLGRPLPNYQAFVVDASLRPLPVGVPGELLIGGAGVARGYLGRTELTDERFIANPFGAGRVYRTGDRVRMLADGNVEFLGRMDGQVKIRGFRVELGEIEAALRQAPGVAECAVVARDDSGDLRLVAYVVGGADAEALRALLRRDLPEYMVPAAFVRMDALPLTANGKLDRRALPAPDFAPDADTWVAPRTEDEARLAAIWAEVLRLERVGVEDNFFQVGGHSLLATRVVSRIREEMDATVGLVAFFENPTVASLAAHLAASRATAPDVAPADEVDASLASPDLLLGLVDQLSEEELDRLLSGHA
jgi:amino acid adenylation domain-containing protein